MGYFSDNPELKEETIVPEYRRGCGSWYDYYADIRRQLHETK
jgi:hypothetical protein